MKKLPQSSKQAKPAAVKKNIRQLDTDSDTNSSDWKSASSTDTDTEDSPSPDSDSGSKIEKMNDDESSHTDTEIVSFRDGFIVVKENLPI